MSTMRETVVVDEGAIDEHDDSKVDTEEEFDSDDDEEEDDEDDDDFRQYLFDKEFLKQHALAIVVAVLGAAISHFHLIPMVNDNYYASQKVFSSKNKYGTSDILHEYHSYRRTENIKFCPFEESISIDETHEERIRRVLYGTQNINNNNQNFQFGEKNIDKGLQLFHFNLPREFVDIMGIHYLADQLKDNSYNISFTSQKGIDGSFNNNEIYNEEYKCLLNENSNPSNKKSTIQASIPVYISPEFSTFYKEAARSNYVSSSSTINSVKEAKQQQLNQPGQKLKSPVSLSHTGFAAKFYNFSPKALNLYWDGNSGHAKKLIGTIQPFEAIGTATFPGNSFYVAPLHDKEYALKRWVATADNAVLVYDPYGATVEYSREKILASLENDLDHDQILKYRMQLLNLAFGREYLAQTKRTWLSTFPKPNVMYHMWSADHFGHVFEVLSKESQFLSLPSDAELERLTSHEDHYKINEKKHLHLGKHRDPSPMEMKVKVLSVAPRVFEVENFLSPVEVQHILDLTKKHNITMNESTLSPGLSGGVSMKGDLRKKEKININADKNTRSSTNAWIDREISPVVDAVYRRVADLLNIDESLMRHHKDFESSESPTHHSIAEAMQLVHYAHGQHYSAHHDFLYPSLLNRFQPSRFVTLLMYLNDVKDGGETVFPRALNDFSSEGITIKPKAGKIIFFYNVLPDGNVDDLSQHASLPVLGKNEEKWISNLWVWDPIID